jgi:hypothetical protein
MKADWNWYATVILILEPEDRLALKHRILPYSIDRFPIMMDQR